jgi:hypothetical protein
MSRFQWPNSAEIAACNLDVICETDHLVLVGSWEFFVAQLKDRPADVDQYLGFWRIATDYLSECFAAGTAVRLQATSLGGPLP